MGFLFRWIAQDSPPHSPEYKSTTMEALSLLRKVAIVTGSSSGIGAAAAKLMARRGAQITLHGRNQDRLEAVKADIINSGIASNNVISVTGDVTDAKVREQIVSETLGAFGQIDILINNAGAGAPATPLVELTKEGLNSSLDVLLHSVIQLSQLCHPHLAKTKGNIVNISSILGTVAIPGMYGYSCAKAGLDMFTVYAATEFGKDKIRVNSVSPGPINTPLHRRARPENPESADEFLAAAAAAAPLGSVGISEDVAEIIAFYASDAAKHITGDNNIIDGGLSLPIVFR
ncbi:3-oxoacyl-[acyl-carrier-protein] reductase FabG [Aplysia californica]|uniref:3-oxoacyl-[acyl-carrier-protein] reductase FabG n=1 Tax=Aplysia californica TaxID=6500 RepID=A0ABM1VUQ1_APLCA|nr:3-oxoacyl-[acyl-carrier-protein] reductase FabG [Aplysia californica]